MKNLFRRWHSFFSSPSYSRTVALIGLLILLAALPITVIFLGQKTNIFQHAAGPTMYSCLFDGNTASGMNALAYLYYDPMTRKTYKVGFNPEKYCSSGYVCHLTPQSTSTYTDPAGNRTPYSNSSVSICVAGCIYAGGSCTPNSYVCPNGTMNLTCSNSNYTPQCCKPLPPSGVPQGYRCVNDHNADHSGNNQLMTVDGKHLNQYCSSGYLCGVNTSGVGASAASTRYYAAGHVYYSLSSVDICYKPGSSAPPPASSCNEGKLCPDGVDVCYHGACHGCNDNRLACAKNANGTASGKTCNSTTGLCEVSSNSGGGGSSGGPGGGISNGPANPPTSSGSSCQKGKTTSFVLSVKLQGIGTGSFENNTPAHPTRTPVYMKIADEKGNFVYNPPHPQQLTYTNGLFMSRQISLGTTLTCGHTYKITLKLPTYIPASAPITYALQPQTISLTPIAGDINGVTNGVITGDGSITVNDYALVASCRNQSATTTHSFMSGSSTVSATCGDLMNFIDYPDGGTTGDEWSFNYNVWLRGFLGVGSGSCTDPSGATIQPGHECSNKSICESGACVAGCAAPGRTCDTPGDVCPAKGGACVKK